MKQYPSIQKQVQNLPIYAFNKLDGSNIRAEWSRKRMGFYKIGSKTQLIDSTHLTLGKAPGLLIEKYEKTLSDIFIKKRFESAISFFEFWGEKSFAGQHDLNDPTLKVTLIDINPFKKGILPPAEFLELVDGKADYASLLYRGNANSDFVASVREGRLPGMSLEGVVCKAKSPDRTPMPLMFKIKQLAWLEQLKIFCKGDEELFQKLA